MPENRISAQLSQADRTAVMVAVNTLRQKLPFLLDLSRFFRDWHAFRAICAWL